MEDSGKEEEDKKSCCTWPKIVVAAILTVTCCIILWKYAPIDSAIDSILPKFNKTSGDYSDTGGAFGDIPPTEAPSTPDRFNFMQCKQGKECCNGLPKICHLGVDEILYATAHNAMASFEDGFLFGPNHRLQLERALFAGYRGINLDICNCAGLLVFCHGYCSLGIRGVDEVFASINGFLDSNPTEVLMMPMEINNFADESVDLDQFYFQMTQIPGLIEKVYIRENDNAPWPTLKKAVDSNKRIFMFHFNGPDCTTANPCPPGLHLYDKYAIDTNWEFRNLEDVEDSPVSCDLVLKEALSHQAFFGVNNFLSPPSYSVSKTLNSVDFARERIRACSEQANLDVNFIYADFWSEGALPELVQEHNRGLARRRQRTLRRTD